MSLLCTGPETCHSLFNESYRDLNLRAGLGEGALNSYFTFDVTLPSSVLDAAVNPLVCSHAVHALQILPIRIATQNLGDKKGSYDKKTGNHVFHGAREDRAQAPQRVERAHLEIFERYKEHFVALKCLRAQHTHKVDAMRFSSALSIIFSLTSITLALTPCPNGQSDCDVLTCAPGLRTCLPSYCTGIICSKPQCVSMSLQCPVCTEVKQLSARF